MSKLTIPDAEKYECGQCGEFMILSRRVEVHFCPECALKVERVDQ